MPYSLSLLDHCVTVPTVLCLCASVFSCFSPMFSSILQLALQNLLADSGFDWFIFFCAYSQNHLCFSIAPVTHLTINWHLDIFHLLCLSLSCSSQFFTLKAFFRKCLVNNTSIYQDLVFESSLRIWSVLTICTGRLVCVCVYVF